MYEEGTSTITSPNMIDDKDAENGYRLSSNKRKRTWYKKNMRDLIELSKICKGKMIIPLNEEVMIDIIKEDYNPEFESMCDIVDENPITEMCLDEKTKNLLRIQKLKKIYNKLLYSKTNEFDDKYQSESMLEVLDHMNDLGNDSIQSIIAKSLQASEVSHVLLKHKISKEEINIEEVKGRRENILKVHLKSNGKFKNKGLNDTFLPKRWNAYDFIYKGNQKLRQGRPLKDYMGYINMENNQNDDFKEKRMLIEFTAILKIQEKFHHWIYNYLNTKVKDLKKSLHEKSDQAREYFNKIADNANKGLDEDSIDKLDPIIENPSANFVCCLCNRKGERKLSGRIIPFRNLQSVHVNCALWSSEVFEGNEGCLVNFYFAYKRAKGAKCVFCGNPGASVGCNSKKCHLNYHFICAVNQQAAFLHNKVMYCYQCAQNKEHPVGYPPELNTKRRFYIGKNNVPFANSNDMVENNFERWKSFGYESFNRVGNLTVIRLNKSITKKCSFKSSAFWSY